MVMFFESQDAPAKVLKDVELLLLQNSQVVCALIMCQNALNFYYKHNTDSPFSHKEQSEVRFCAVRWATSLFDLKHCPSRFICMLGAADSKLDIR